MKIFTALLTVCVFGVQASQRETVESVAKSLGFVLLPGVSYEYTMQKTEDVEYRSTQAGAVIKEIYPRCCALTIRSTDKRAAEEPYQRYVASKGRDGFKASFLVGNELSMPFVPGDFSSLIQIYGSLPGPEEVLHPLLSTKKGSFEGSRVSDETKK